MHHLHDRSLANTVVSMLSGAAEEPDPGSVPTAHSMLCCSTEQSMPASWSAWELASASMASYGSSFSEYYSADRWLQSVVDVHAEHMDEAARAASEAEAALRAAHSPLAAALDHQADQLQQFVARQQLEATAALTETEALLEEGTR